ncbi:MULTISPECIES: RHS repeat-associated core domain-containing protein [unclassified Pseudomonas]|uniref:RHS repeat domain-containing protein n=1 Tax=Pseudomonas sp. SK2 TaxID=2841063 RepID=UPI0020790024|nr:MULTISPECIES: RHS repeat-associated core domain-containing protein [unclassified Pseudomonas]
MVAAPLWQHEVKPQPIDAIAWYQCDHLGTPMELTDHHGEVAWAGQYKAWGDVSEVRSDWAKQVGMTNPIRFQGQYHDHETGLHYNRYRYYDPRVGRFVSQDPISYFGGLSLYAYTLNPLHWVDALGLAPTPLNQPGYTVYGLYEPKATKPYYVGHTMQAESVREAQHANTGRLGEAKLVPIAKDLTYTQAKGRSNIIEKCMILRLVSLVM